MRKNIFTSDRKGFSLLELSVVLIIMSILASAVIPVLTRSFLEKAGEKVSLDMFAIEDAARAYYIANGSWPTSIIPAGNMPPTDLESNGFLPSGWSPVNPFSSINNPPYTISNNGEVFSVSTKVIDGSQIAITNRLPVSSYSGTTVSTSIPPPGASTTGWGVPISINMGQSYYAATDGVIQGLVYTVRNSIEYQVYSDSNNPPQTALQECQEGTYSTNNGGYAEGLPVNCIIHKGNYYEVTPSGQPNGSNLVFMPLGV